MAHGFFKYSQIVADRGEVGDFVAPFMLASHLLATKELHSALIDEHRIHVYCANTLWEKIREDIQVDGTPVRNFSIVVIDLINAYVPPLLLLARTDK